MLNFLIENKASNIDGKGAFATQLIPPHKKIGNLGGEIIFQREARKRAGKIRRVAMVEFGNGTALDASINPNELRYINHSCSPNVYMRRCYNLVEFYSLRQIDEGEELTCDYGETHHNGKLKCRCGAAASRSYI